MKRILKINYRKVDTGELANWLTDNNYKFELIHDNNVCTDGFDQDTVIGSLILSLELFTDEAEVATRLKWDVEQ